MGLFKDITAIANSLGDKASELDSALQQQQISGSVLAQLQPLLDQITDSSRPLSAIYGDVNKLMGMGGTSPGGGSGQTVKALKIVKLMTDIAGVKARLQQLQEELDDALDETRRPAKSDQDAIKRMLNDLSQDDGAQDSAAQLKRQQQMFDLLSKMVTTMGDQQKSVINNMR